MMSHLKALPHPLLLLIAGILLLSIAHSATAASNTFELPSFSKIDIGSSLTARIETGSTQSVRVDGATARDLERLHLDVVDGTLRAWSDRDFLDFSFSRPAFIITISLPGLSDLAVDAASDVTASAMSGDIVALRVGSGSKLVATGIKAGSARIDVSSGSSLVVDGTCDNGYVQASSGASIAGKALMCLEMNVEASSSSQAVLYVTQRATAVASSGSHVELFGKPTHVDDQENSGGDVDVMR